MIVRVSFFYVYCSSSFWVIKYDVIICIVTLCCILQNTYDNVSHTCLPGVPTPFLLPAWCRQAPHVIPVGIRFTHDHSHAEYKTTLWVSHSITWIGAQSGADPMPVVALIFVIVYLYNIYLCLLNKVMYLNLHLHEFFLLLQ